MKKILFITMLAFCASVLNAAPADEQDEATATQPTQPAKKKVVKKTAKKKATKKTAKSKADERKEAQQRQFGLMPSEVDNQNRNVFAADAMAIRGAKDTESALRYIPFVTIVNTAGFGNQFDLRGQGRISSNGLNFQINGVPMTPLDTYYGFMPINTVLPSLIQQVSILPGVENRGGTINIITSKRQAPYFVIGAGYVNTAATEGNSYNAFAQVADDINAKTRANAGLAFTQMGGPREDDSAMGAEGALGLDYDLGAGKVVVDADFFYGKTKTTPYNSFLNSVEIENLVRQNGNGDRATLYTNIENLPYFEPGKDNRATKGDGEIEITQMRFVGSAGYVYEVEDKFRFDGIVFYAFDERKFDKHETYIPYYGYGGTSKWAPWSQALAASQISGSKKNAWNLLDQTDSSFKESKIGVKLQVDAKHDGGEFFAGYHGVWEQSKRNPVQRLRSALTSTNVANSQNVEILIDNQLDTTKFTNTFFIKERYDFNSYFSVLGGFKYELQNFSVKANDDMSLNTLTYDNATDSITNSTPRIQNKLISGDYKKNYDNFAFELAPALRYSGTGVVYGRFESGYITPPGYAILQRSGTFIPGNNNANITNGTAFETFNYAENTNVKQESYMTGELGWRELIGTRTIPLGFTSFDINALLFSVSGFYTQSKDEFYFEGDAYSGLTYDTYEKSRRMGVEVALEQYFFDGILGLNESYTWIRAQHWGIVNGEEKWDTIPYTYDYKATLGVNVNVSAFVEVIDVSLGIWLQNSLYGNQKVIDKSFAGRDAANNLIQTDNQKKLDPYIISDFGISIGLNKDMGVITAGVKNVFDTFYYDYYNNDRAATINENRYVIGRGRTVFIEGTFRY